MKVKFYAHACFRLESDGRAIVTDPYEPKVSWFDPIDEPADLVLMSSNTDRFHCDPSHVQGNPKVLNALEIPSQGVQVDGLTVRAFPSRERYQWPLLIRGILPRKNAMYTFTLGGVRVLHTGDIGRAFTRGQLAALSGQVDVMLALSGAVHNIEHDDLMKGIEAIRPRVVIPMHYYSPKGRLKILPVEAIAGRFPADRVVRVGGPEVEITPETLPESTSLYILEQSR
jgi:L-ascorbate metabolism protein UlaG (beta-lactamase superfamily)